MLVNLRVEKQRQRWRKGERERFIDRDIVVFRLHRTMDPFPEVERKLYVVRVGDNTRTDTASIHPPSLRGRNFGCRRRHQDGNRKLDNPEHTAIVAAATIQRRQRLFVRHGN